MAASGHATTGQAWPITAWLEPTAIAPSPNSGSPPASSTVPESQTFSTSSRAADLRRCGDRKVLRRHTRAVGHWEVGATGVRVVVLAMARDPHDVRIDVRVRVEKLGCVGSRFHQRLNTKSSGSENLGDTVEFDLTHIEASPDEDRTTTGTIRSWLPQ